MTVVDAPGAVPVSGPAAMGLLEGSVRLSGVQALVRVLIDQGRADLARGRLRETERRELVDVAAV